MQVAVPSRLYVPAQPLASHEAAFPHVAVVGVQGQPVRVFLQVADPSALKVPAQLVASQLGAEGQQAQPAPLFLHVEDPSELEVPAQLLAVQACSAGHWNPGVLLEGTHAQPFMATVVHAPAPLAKVPAQLELSQDCGVESQAATMVDAGHLK